MKKFNPTNKKWLSVIWPFALLALIILFNAPDIKAAWGGIALIVSILLLLILSEKSRCLLLNADDLILTRFFLFRTVVPFSSIKEIEIVRSLENPFELRIYWGDGQLLRQSLALWEEEMVTELIRHILTKNKDILISEPYKRLLTESITEKQVITEIRKSEKKDFAYIPRAGAGAIIGMGLFFSGFYLANTLNPYLGESSILIFPIGIAITIYSIGYAITGDLKKASLFLVPVILLFISAIASR